MAYTRDKDAAALRKLPWVASVVKGKPYLWADPTDHPGYVIKTKPGSLKVRVTHNVHVAGDLIQPGEELQEPFLVPLPEFVIELRQYGDNVVLALQKMPSMKNHEFFVPFPAYDGSHRYRNKWEHAIGLCWGEWDYMYDDATTWLDRANILAAYLQTAIPHLERNRHGSRYAYLMGLMPKQHCVAKEYLEGDYDDDNLWD